MKSKPSGLVTWTEKKTDSGTGNFLQIDLTPGRVQNEYSPEGVWYSSSQWVFQPLEDNCSVFVLRNRDDLSRIVSTKYDDDTGYTFLTWEQELSSHLQAKSLLTPIGTPDTSDYKIKLQFSRYPDRFVTWTWLKYENSSHFLQIAPLGTEYSYGGSHWNDIMFKFSPATKGVIIRFQPMSSIEFTQKAVDVLQQSGEMVTIYKESFQNYGPYPTTTVIKTALPDTSAGILTITNAALQPHIKLPMNFTFSLPYQGLKSNTTAKRSFENIMFTVTSVQATSNSSSKIFLVKPLNRVLPLPSNVAVNVETGKVIDFTVKQQLFKNVELPFVINLPVFGEGDRLRADLSVARGPLPQDVVATALSKKLGVDPDGDVRVEGGKMFLRVGGIITGTFLLGLETIPTIV